MSVWNKLKKVKMIFIISLFLIGFTIIFSVIFLRGSANKAGLYNLDDNSIKYVKGEGLEVSGDDIVKMYNTKTNQIEEIPLEDYVIGVVCAEMPANFSEEAIKAQAVAARTYYFSKRLNHCSKNTDAEICNSTHCQVYMNKEERMAAWGKDEAEDNWNKIVSAVEATKGQVLTYNNELVKRPQFFAISSGKTEDAVDVFSEDVPYLKSTDSEGEQIAPKYETTVDIKLTEFVNKLNNECKNAGLTTANASKKIKINSNTEGGAVKEIQIGNDVLTGVKFRELFGLNSANFTLSYSNNVVKVTCKGYGHGVGMSQWGANVMAKQGKDYEEILKHYYVGVEITKISFKG